MSSPLFGLLVKGLDFCWIDKCQEAFEVIKEKLITAPILRAPNWAFPFHIHIYESDKVVGEALGQVEDKLPYAIYFISKNLYNV